MSGGIGHGPVAAADLHAVPVREELDILGEVDQQDVLREILDGRARVTRQPVGNDIGLSLHRSPNTQHFLPPVEEQFFVHERFIDSSKGARQANYRSKGSRG